MKHIEIFLQGEGIKEVVLLKVHEEGFVRDIIEVAEAEGILVGGPKESFFVFSEEHDSELPLDTTFKKVGIHHRSLVHVHRCKSISVFVNFSGNTLEHSFPPATKIKRIHQWATGDQGFNMTRLDASEHALQISGTFIRPDEDIQLGSLVSSDNCTISFDLVPKKRVEG